MVVGNLMMLYLDREELRRSNGVDVIDNGGRSFVSWSVDREELRRSNGAVFGCDVCDGVWPAGIDGGGGEKSCG
ncbi:hypothetical protein HanXRQr2_Chr15g0689501 [Helianthus annuus]|uniref:Uncharacterized protein n=1 Tax=Helianthus annuus TaxID=4232 RepID=A0A9K3E0Y3_HELAN|nr:hypothetical protein HanXRQr2_Chr15g0689501 [Helianthus annuus]